MANSNEQVAATLTATLFSTIDKKIIIDGYSIYSKQSKYLQDEILKVYQFFLKKLEDQKDNP